MEQKQKLMQFWKEYFRFHPDLLGAFSVVQRENFISKSVRDVAYEDRPLPLLRGKTISQPTTVMIMTAALEPKKGDRVFEIGTGSGYQAAVLSTIAKEVYTIEIIEALGLRAEESLKNIGYDNVNVKISNGSLGWPDKGLFDAIIVTAAAEKIPDPLIKQLKPGGRMVIPVNNSFYSQDLLIVEKDEAGNIDTKKTIPVRFVPLIEGEKVTK